MNKHTVTLITLILILSSCEPSKNRYGHILHKDGESLSDTLRIDEAAWIGTERGTITPFEYSWNYYGVKEFATRQSNNSIIVDFFKDLGAKIYDDETAWCSVYMNSMHIRTGYEFSNSLLARSWLDVGYEISKPKAGDIVVFWRGSSPSSWKGHVGFYLRHNSSRTKILVYGGNQSNSVVPQWYPAYRVLGYRRTCPADNQGAYITIDSELINYLN